MNPHRTCQTCIFNEGNRCMHLRVRHRGAAARAGDDIRSSEGLLTQGLCMDSAGAKCLVWG